MKNLLFIIAILFSASTIFALPGDLDTAFGVNGGYFLSDFGAADRDERPRDVAVQADGKIVIVGRNETATDFFYDFLVARYNADGTPDVTFDGDGFFTFDSGGQLDFGNAVAIQSDGKIVVAGGLGDTVNTAYVIRLNMDGTLDTTFDTDGIATVVGPGEALSVAIRADGKIVFTAGYENFFTGWSAAVARLNANGSLDTTFDTDGILTISPNVYFPHGLALQTGGKVIVAGTSSTASSNQDVALIRLNSDGTYDTTFDGDGLVETIVPGEDSEARCVLIQTDNKILIGGSSEASGEDPLLIRYNSDGTLDTTFDSDGIKTVELLNNNEDSYFQEIALQEDGKIVAIASDTSTTFPFPRRDDFFVVRYNADGSTDNSFDTNGIVNSQWCEYGTELALQTDGKIIAAGSRDRLDDTEFDHIICVQRLNPDGLVDYSFNAFPSNGKTILAGFGLTEISAVAGLPNGKIMVAGWLNNYGTSNVVDSVLLRLNADGSLDTSFMNEGFYVRTGLSSTSPNYFYDLKILSDGSFFVVGEAGTLGGIIVKFNSAGVPDTTFSGDGVATTTNIARIYGIAIQPDGKIIGCGSSGSTIRNGRIARFSVTGTFETSAANNLGASGNNNEILECGLQSDGKIIVAGYGLNTMLNSEFIGISRHLTNLSLDTTFGTSGVTTTDMSATLNDRATDMVIQSDNKIVVSSMGFNTDRDFAVLRYDANGTLDPSLAENFGTGGISLIDFVFGNPNDEANAILLQPDGQILVGGTSVFTSDTRFSLAKLNPDGTLVFGFGTLGRTTAVFPNDNARINALSFYQNDKILAAGRTWNGTDYDFALARFDNEFVPTTANVSISGKVLTSSGRAIQNASVSITDMNGNIRITKTNPFGNYYFEELTAGETYIIGVFSKSYTFNSEIITPKDSLANVNFVALEKVR